MKKIYILLLLMLLMVITGCTPGNGSNPIPELSSSLKAITSFSLSEVVGTINETEKTIAVAMPFGTDVTAMVATFTTNGASVKVGETVQVSGTTVNNFTNQVTYTVTAADATTQDYIVVVTVAKASAKAITAFSLNGSAGTINETAKTIAVTMPFGTSVTNLVATFTTTGTSVKVGSTVQESGTTAHNFTSPVTYTVTAADTTTQDYVVTVTPASSSETDILTFTIPSQVGSSVIDATAHTVSVVMPYGSSTTQAPTITVSAGATINPVSGAAHSFASSATYTVTAEDGTTTQDWVVTVTPRTVGQVATFTDGVTPFKMMYVPGGITFPTGTDDLGTPATVAGAYWIGETAVTYELWHKIYLWATTNAGGGLRADGGALYYFQHVGGDSGQQPVNDINPRDMIVFSNAITEWYNANNGTDQDYVCVYKDSGVPIRDSRDANGAQCDAVVQDTSANGFRLLTSNEWELAARWRNDSTNTVAGYTNPYFTKGNSASGATNAYTDGTNTALYAVYGTGTTPSVVKTKLPNALGLYDMSGNVNNLDFNYIPSTTDRSIRGGSCGMGAIATQVGSSTGSSGPSGYAYWIGLRLSRTDL